MQDAEVLTHAPRQDAIAPRLSASVEGVEFWITSAGGERLRCVITDAALQAHCGTEANDRESWLQAFLQHRDDIEQLAYAACDRRDDVHVIVVTDSSGHLKAIAGRCTR